MKLFVWENVLCDYTCGLAVVFAEDETQARELMIEYFPDYVINELPFAKCRVVEQPDAFYVYGGS